MRTVTGAVLFCLFVSIGASLAGGRQAAADVLHRHDAPPVVGVLTGVGADGTHRVATTDRTVEVQAHELVSIEDRATLSKALAQGRADAKSDLGAQWRLAEWAARKGLFEEALDLADAVLEAAERLEDPPALAVPDALLALPVGGVDEAAAAETEGALSLLRAAAAAGPARRVVARERVKRHAREAAVIAALRRAMREPSPRVRATALSVAALATPPETLEDVMRAVLFDRDATVRHAAIAALQAYQAEGKTAPLVRALEQEDPRLRSAAMDAIEALHSQHAVAALVRNLRRASGGGVLRNNFSSIQHVSIVKDFDVEIAQAAVIAQPVVDVVQEGQILDVGVAGVVDRGFPAAERARIASLLGLLTGVDLGPHPDAWEEWLQRR